MTATDIVFNELVDMGSPEQFDAAETLLWRLGELVSLLWPR